MNSYRTVIPRATAHKRRQEDRGVAAIKKNEITEEVVDSDEIRPYQIAITDSTQKPKLEEKE